MILVNKNVESSPIPFLFYRTTTESEFDLERVNGDPLDEADDPFGVLVVLLQSQLPLRL